MGEVKHDHGDFDDQRIIGDWKTRYPLKAWIYIIGELVYLLALLGITIVLFVDVFSLSELQTGDGVMYSSLLGLQFTNEVGKWYALTLSGMVGGTVFDLKWLYHSVARGIWNFDRCLWRLIVPLNSAMVSLFTGFIFASGIVPFLKNEQFDDLYTLLGAGFIFGYFSDSILAAMQKLAKRFFGTLNSDG